MSASSVISAMLARSPRPSAISRTAASMSACRVRALRRSSRDTFGAPAADAASAITAPPAVPPRTLAGAFPLTSPRPPIADRRSASVSVNLISILIVYINVDYQAAGCRGAGPGHCAGSTGPGARAASRARAGGENQREHGGDEQPPPALHHHHGRSLGKGLFPHDRVQGVAGPAQLDALHDRIDPLDQVEQTEQQREGDRAHAGVGEQHHAERDRGQPAEDEQRPRPGRLAGAEGGGDLDEAGDDRPAGHDRHQDQCGGPRPGQRDHPGGEVGQPEQQVPDDRPRLGAAERPHGLQAGGDEQPLVHDWRVARLARLGIPRSLAEVYADHLDWHQVARLVQRGCPRSWPCASPADERTTPAASVARTVDSGVAVWIGAAAARREGVDMTSGVSDTPRSGQPPATGGLAWHTLSTDQVLQSEGVDGQRGLSSAEVAARARRSGPNELAAGKAEPRWHAFLRQYSDPMQIVLLAAGIGSLYPLKQLGTGVLLILLTLFNAVEGLQQEGKAAAAVAALQKTMIIKARVRRDDQLADIPAEQLVPGDIVSIEAGDVVPADGRLLKAATLEVDESALTGESLPAAKGTEPVAGAGTPLGDRADMVYMNTNVTRGAGEFVITATGMATEVGHISGMLAEEQAVKTPLTRQMDRLLPRAATVIDADAGPAPADGEFRQRYLAENQRLAEQGLRVIATARRDLDPAAFDPGADLLPLVTGLESGHPAGWTADTRGSRPQARARHCHPARPPRIGRPASAHIRLVTVQLAGLRPLRWGLPRHPGTR